MSPLDCNILSKSAEILRRYPLCSRCLGRLFAKYGLGLSNITRGNAIKTLLLMELHRLVSANIANLNMLREVSDNVGVMPQLISRYLGTVPARRKCYVCSGEVEWMISRLAEEAVSELSRFRVRNFVISIRKGSEMERRELDIISEFNLDSWESIRRELKRELGKKVKALTGLEPEFKHPDASVLVDLDALEVKVVTTPTYILCRYVKLGRNISQVRWVSKDGIRRRPLAVEDVVEPVARLLGAEAFQIHSVGREDVDVRILGNGRPLVLEFKNVKDKTARVEELGKAITRNDLLFVFLDKFVDRKHLREVKSKKSVKVYRVLTLSKNPLGSDSAEVLAREFSNRVVEQRTPTRALGRRGNSTHMRKVYGVKSRVLGGHLLEMLVMCDGDMYVREFVHGDGGRTSPSIAEVLGTELDVLEIDVVDILY